MDNVNIISLPDKFDFSFHKEFTRRYDDSILNTDVAEIVLDFSRVNYLDSSALGMMVLLYRKAQACNKRVSVKNVSGKTAEILKMANFQKLYAFE
ncbi:SpoIIAA family protein [Marinomonas sp. MED121]|uniref:STAS domain-containing protein n=1 Tax=Marinomonas sp. MED121 TaxID=314277 RepID=UPI00006904AA|nr:STAS domain-containing protein [Marinomonas sp. MED121]EAQ64642.1 SpoIIAA family protein [Marinomonas sp. MED121]